MTEELPSHPPANVWFSILSDECLGFLFDTNNELCLAIFYLWKEIFQCSCAKLLGFPLHRDLVPLHNACSYGHYEVTELLVKVSFLIVCNFYGKVIAILFLSVLVF